MAWDYNDWENDNEDRLEELGQAYQKWYRKSEITQRLDEIDVELKKDSLDEKRKQELEKERETLLQELASLEDQNEA